MNIASLHFRATFAAMLDRNDEVAVRAVADARYAVTFLRPVGSGGCRRRIARLTTPQINLASPAHAPKFVTFPAARRRLNNDLRTSRAAEPLVPHHAGAAPDIPERARDVAKMRTDDNSANARPASGSKPNLHKRRGNRSGWRLGDGIFSGLGEHPARW